jgi:aldose sugar dehydrogenase
MINRKLLLLVSLCVFLFSFIATKNNEKEIAKNNLELNKPREIYTQYCSTCHGEKVEAFVDRQWKHGNSKSNLIASITKGYADKGMPSWKDKLKPKEIEGLADLIIESLKTVEQYRFENKIKSNVFEHKSLTIKLDTVLTGIESAWGFVQLPDYSFIISDRAGQLIHVNQDKTKTIISNVPEVLSEGQGGLLDVEIHPDYINNHYVYLSYSKFKSENGKKLSTTAIARAKFENNSLIDFKDIFIAEPYTKSEYHYGSRIQFDKDNYMYFSVGERGNKDDNPQSLGNHLGKIHRLKDDGTIPSDNPFVNSENQMASIFSYGHRNPQGLVYNPKTNQMWETEHGPRGGDEVNIIKKGANFGWPVISYGINYDGTTFTNITKNEGMEQPETYWIPSIAPSGLAFNFGDKYPEWQNDLFVGSLRFKYLNRCVVKDNKIIEQEKLLVNIGRLRNIKMGKDGYLYVGVETPGAVYRLLPVRK